MRWAVSFEGLALYEADLGWVVPEQAAVEEGIVIGGGCTFLKLAQKVEAIKETLENDEQKARVKEKEKSSRHMPAGQDASSQHMRCAEGAPQCSQSGLAQPGVLQHASEILVPACHLCTARDGSVAMFGRGSF